MVFVGRPKRKEAPGKPRHKWEDSIKMDLRQIGWGSMDWIHMAQGRDQ
jgi:hypothetical protein